MTGTEEIELHFGENKNMEILGFLIQIATFLIVLLWTICAWIIWTYNYNKPLGMQTLLDFMIKDLILTSSLGVLFLVILVILTIHFRPILSLLP